MQRIDHGLHCEDPNHVNRRLGVPEEIHVKAGNVTGACRAWLELNKIQASDLPTMTIHRIVQCRSYPCGLMHQLWPAGGTDVSTTNIYRPAQQTSRVAVASIGACSDDGSTEPSVHHQSQPGKSPLSFQHTGMTDNISHITIWITMFSRRIIILSL